MYQNSFNIKKYTWDCVYTFYKFNLRLNPLLDIAKPPRLSFIQQGKTVGGNSLFKQTKTRGQAQGQMRDSQNDLASPHFQFRTRVRNWDANSGRAPTIELDRFQRSFKDIKAIFESICHMM